ncbi:hypothetical protein M408DRAFT_311292 [Serendipita vermifera MAFF 305830]|uniref:DNA 3'-5' helicase n=1 Tax=Serendipita vermifera MAFF 305830 TaxID=933852 RepID=A0A0C2XE81_SERVB|nr:hypothetical protein M408DRAFT_311292 [Serendipita vermifera MAFF 305830]
MAPKPHICPFCYSENVTQLEKFNNVTLARHIVESHGFENDTLIITDIRVETRNYKVILYKNDQCPIAGCTKYHSSDLAKHIKTCTTHEEQALKDYLSTKQSAIDFYRDQAVDQLDTADAAEGDLVYNESINEQLVPPHLDPLPLGNDIEDEPDDIEAEDLAEEPQEEVELMDYELATTPPPLVDIPNLTIVPDLQRHNIGILGLPSFPDNPNVLCCFACKSVINTTQWDTVRKHIRKCDALSIEDPEEDEQAATEEDNDIDMNDNEVIPDMEGEKRAKQPKRVLERCRAIFPTIMSTLRLVKPRGAWPESPIRPIHLFTTVRGYGCTVKACPQAFLHFEPVRAHSRGCQQGKPPSQLHSLYTADTGPNCEMQTLGILHDTYFKVRSIETSPEDNAAAPQPNLKEFLSRRLAAPTPSNEGRLQSHAHTNPFFKRFAYQTVFGSIPVSQYTAFAQSKVTLVTPVHRDTQTQFKQLLALATLAYHLDGSHQLTHTTYLYQRHLGNKLLSAQLGAQERANPFKPLHTNASKIRYSSLHASLLLYVVEKAHGVIDDPELVLCPQHTLAARELIQQLENTLQLDGIQAQLASVRSLRKDGVFVAPPQLFAPQVVSPALVTACQRLMPFIHTLAYSILYYPRYLPNGQSIVTTPITRFMAFMSWDTAVNIFKTPVSIHNTLAHMQYDLRMVGFKELLRMDTTDPVPLLCRIHDETLCQDSTTPFGILQDQLRYASSLCTDVEGISDAQWKAETQAATLNGVAIPRVRFQEMLQATTNELLDTLNEKIFFGKRERVFQGRTTFKREGSIIDMVRCNDPEYSYMTKNKCFQQDRGGLFNLITEDPILARRFVYPFTTNGQYVWNIKEITAYLQIIDRWKLVLAALLHWTSGMPPRGTESVIATVHNTESMPRSIYCVDGELVIISRYNKTTSMTGHDKPIVRVPPPVLARALEEYIVVVKPVYDKLCSIRDGQVTEVGLQSLLWTIDGRPMTSLELSDSLHRISSPYFPGIQLGLRSWRQILIQMAHNILPEDVRGMTLTTTALIAQSGHSASTESMHYNRQMDTTFSVVSSMQFNQFRAVSLAWFQALGFEHPSQKRVLSTQPGNILDIAHLACQLSANMVPEVVRMTETELERRRDARMALQQAESDQACSIRPLKQSVGREALEALRALYPNVYSFRSLEQGMAIQFALLRTKEALFVHLPTGSGKSAVYLAPVKQESQTYTTVLLVPLLSLAQSAKIVAERHGIRVSLVDTTFSQRPGAIEYGDLVIMTYDKFVQNQQIRAEIRTRVDQKSIARIVLDEAHALITDTYREAFLRIFNQLSELRVQKLLLSGTLPRSVMSDMLKGLKDHEIAFHVHLPGDRPNLAYSVEATLFASNKAIPQFCDHIRNTLLPILSQQSQSRAIVFTRYVDWATTIAAELECRLYTGPAEAETKKKDLDEWLRMEGQSATKRLLVGTSAIALGIDHPHVCIVWMYGDPFDAITLHQMAARAGRDGEIASVRLFPEASPAMEDPIIKQIKETKGCRRTPLSLHLDNRSVTCIALPSAQLCDHCESGLVTALPAWSPPLSSTYGPALRRQRVSLVVQSLYEALKIVERHCVICILLDTGLPNHAVTECPSGYQHRLWDVKQAVSRLSNRSSIPGFAVCLVCHMPQKAGFDTGMDLHMRTFDLQNQVCKLEDQAVLAIIGLLASQRCHGTIMALTPTGSEHDALATLFSVVKTSPCSSVDAGRQLLNLHFLLVAAVAAATPGASHLLELVAEPWFDSWRMSERRPQSTASLLDAVPQYAPPVAPTFAQSTVSLPDTVSPPLGSFASLSTMTKSHFNTF